MKGMNWSWTLAGLAALALCGCGGPKAVEGAPAPTPSGEIPTVKAAPATGLAVRMVGEWIGEAETTVKTDMRGREKESDQVKGASKGVSPHLLDQLGGYSLSLNQDGTYKMQLATTPITGVWTLAGKEVGLTPLKVLDMSAAELAKDPDLKDMIHLAEPKTLPVEKNGAELRYKDSKGFAVHFRRK